MRVGCGRAGARVRPWGANAPLAPKVEWRRCVIIAGGRGVGRCVAMFMVVIRVLGGVHSLMVYGAVRLTALRKESNGRRGGRLVGYLGDGCGGLGSVREDDADARRTIGDGMGGAYAVGCGRCRRPVCRRGGLASSSPRLRLLRGGGRDITNSPPGPGGDFPWLATKTAMGGNEEYGNG